MEQLINKKYKMLYPSEQKLLKFGFRKVKNIDDDIIFNMQEGNRNTCKLERELPQNNFNIRTLTQDTIEEMKRNSNVEWIPRL